MENIRPPRVKRFKNTEAETILTHRGELPWDSVDMYDYVPELPTDKTDRVLRALTVMGLAFESDLERVHEHEKKHHMTHFMFPHEISMLLHKKVHPGKCGKNDVELVWNEIKQYRPHRDIEGSDGLRAWDGDLNYQHDWDTEVYRNRHMVTLPEPAGAVSKIKKASSELFEN